MEVASWSVHDEKALFDEDDGDEDEIVIGRAKEVEPEETSKQRLLSRTKLPPQFEGLKTLTAGHKIQEIREMMTVPVRIRRLLGNEQYTDLIPVTGYRHCGPHQEPTRDQGLQCEPLRRAEINVQGSVFSLSPSTQSRNRSHMSHLYDIWMEFLMHASLISLRCFYRASHVFSCLASVQLLLMARKPLMSVVVVHN